MTFEINLRDDGAAEPDQPRGVSVRAGEIVFTRLIRPGAPEPDDFLRAPLAPLAFWLIDNWWRLRWEGIPPAGMTADWKLAHDMTSIGGGYIWPRLSIWGEEPRIFLLSRSDPQGVVGSVRYLTDAVASARQDGVDSASPESSLREMTPWVAAEHMAATLRKQAGVPHGPLRNRTFADLVATRIVSFRQPSSRGPDLPYGLRLRVAESGGGKLCLRSRWPHDRRFEIARALGDAIWDQVGALGPLGAASTARRNSSEPSPRACCARSTI